MVKEEDRWEEANPGQWWDESEAAFRARLIRTAKLVGRRTATMEKALKSMHRRVRELETTGGERIKRD